MSITPSSVVVASSEQRSAGAVIAGLRSGSYYRLNDVAERIWQLLQTPVRVADLPPLVAEEFDVPLEACTGDVLALLERLAAEGLIDVDARTA